MRSYSSVDHLKIELGMLFWVGIRATQFSEFGKKSHTKSNPKSSASYFTSDKIFTVAYTGPHSGIAIAVLCWANEFGETGPENTPNHMQAGGTHEK